MILLSRIAATMLTWLFLLSMPFAAIAGDFPDNVFTPPSLLVSHVQWYLGALLTGKLDGLTGRDPSSQKRAKPGEYSDEEIRLLLAEIDRIAVTIGSSVTEQVIANNKEALNLYLKEFRWAEPISDKRRAKVSAWAKRNAEFMENAMPLVELHSILEIYAPGTLIEQPPCKRADDCLPIQYQKMFGSLHGRMLYKVHHLLNSERAEQLLPERFDVPRLRNESAELFAAGMNIQLREFPDGPLYRSTMSVASLLAPSLHEQESQMNKDLNKLSRKFARKH